MADTGIEIHGRSGEQFLTQSEADACLAALDKHGVVVYRGADISDSQLVSFSRLLGDVIVAPVGGLPDHPEISPVSLDPAKSVLAEYRKSTLFWHIDGVNDETPQRASLLAARVIAEEGGDTEFANAYAAYEALPDEEKQQLEGIKVVHSFAASQRLIYPEPTKKQLAQWTRVPSRVHPLIWTRSTGRKSLLIGATAGEVVGMSESAGRELLDRLLSWATQPRFVLRHAWQPGDLVIWDNTCMLHRARPYDPASLRLLHRTTLAGCEVIA